MRRQQFGQGWGLRSDKRMGKGRAEFDKGRAEFDKGRERCEDTGKEGTEARIALQSFECDE